MDQYILNEKITIGIVLFKEDYDVIYKTLDKIRLFKIIIIDNSFDLKLKKKIEDNFKIEKYILNKKNLGFSSGYNQTLKLCKTDYFLILNPDCVIKEKSIDKITNKINSLKCEIEINEQLKIKIMLKSNAFNTDSAIKSKEGSFDTNKTLYNSKDLNSFVNSKNSFENLSIFTYYPYKLFQEVLYE